MAELTQMIWQSSFVRGLAQSVLERAKVIRSSLPTAVVSKMRLKKFKAKAKKKKPVVRKAKKRATKRAHA